MNDKKHTSLSFIWVFTLLSISSSYAESGLQAQSKSSVSEDILTSSELSQCNARTKQLAQSAEQLKERSKQLQTIKNEMEQMEQERSNEYKEIDFHNKASVAEYNQINQQLNQLSQSYMTDATSYNEAVKQYKSDTLQLTSECDDKRYLLNQ